jgi:hypothetical protein
VEAGVGADNAVATILESMEQLKEILGRGCTPEDRRMYEAEYTAYREVRDGDPFDDSRFHHCAERYAYRAARAQAALQLTIHGKGGTT